MEEGNVSEGRQLISEGTQLLEEVKPIIEELRIKNMEHSTEIQDDLVQDNYELISDEDVSIDEKVSKVVDEAKRIEGMTGRSVSNEELRELCSKVSDEHSFKMDSLSELAETQPRRVENNALPIAFVSGTTGSDYASV